jgi:hypothetical protein
VNTSPATSPASTNRDKQLQGIALESVLEKRRLDQALNAKEFAVCAGISYSTARSWFRLPGFPCFRGVVFWQDFVAWRTGGGARAPHHAQPQVSDNSGLAKLPERAARLLREA